MKLAPKLVKCLAWIDRCQRVHDRYQEYRERYEDAVVYCDDALLVADLVTDTDATLEEIREESEYEADDTSNDE